MANHTFPPGGIMCHPFTSWLRCSQVTFQRVVNIVERRTTVARPEVDYSQDFSPDWYTDADQGFINFQRKLTPPPQEVQPS